MITGQKLDSAPTNKYFNIQTSDFLPSKDKLKINMTKRWKRQTKRPVDQKMKTKQKGKMIETCESNLPCFTAPFVSARDFAV